MVSDRITQIFSVVGAIVASFGGAILVLAAMSGWLGKVWASRIMERERAEWTKSIEATKAAFTSVIEREKAALAALQEERNSELRELSAQRIDALSRKRDVYTELATKMRILIKGNVSPDQLPREQVAFLAAYDGSYLWASEPVAVAVRDLIEVAEKKSFVDKGLKLTPANAPNYVQLRDTAEALDVKAKDLYQRCLLEMRKDSGFPSSTTEYRVVSFG